MDPTADIAEFLTSRRAKVTPDQVVLRTYGPRGAPPGTNLNPADSGWQNPDLQPAARRR